MILHVRSDGLIRNTQIMMTLTFLFCGRKWGMNEVGWDGQRDDKRKQREKQQKTHTLTHENNQIKTTNIFFFCTPALEVAQLGLNKFCYMKAMLQFGV